MSIVHSGQKREFCCMIFSIRFSWPVSLFLGGLFMYSSLAAQQVPMQYSLGYTSSLVYPGLRAAVYAPVRIVTHIHGSKTLLKSRWISPSLAWYRHPGLHDNLYLTAAWVMRRTTRSGVFTEFSPGLGISRTFVSGVTYDVSGGTPVLRRSAGYGYPLAMVGGGIGYDGSQRWQKPVALFLNAHLLTMYPYNSTVFLRPVLEAGLRWMPARGGAFSPKIMTKNK
jgi:hypothetical protein